MIATLPALAAPTLRRRAPLLGGLGLGFGAGALLGGLVHPAHRQSQSTIGAGVGALAGAALAPLTFGASAILGGLIGGAGGRNIIQAIKGAACRH